MNDETVASKVNRLLQKSRQAFRIYSSMSKSAKAEHNEFADMQAIEWKNINAELIRQLTHIVEKYSAKSLALQISRMRDLLLSDFRRVEAELNAEHREIIACAQRADFIRVAQLSRLLISKKAFVQAAQAASHELSLIIEDKVDDVMHDISSTAHKYSNNKYHNNNTPAANANGDSLMSFSDSELAYDKLHHRNTSTRQVILDQTEPAQIISEGPDITEPDGFQRLAKVIQLRR